MDLLGGETAATMTANDYIVVGQQHAYYDDAAAAAASNGTDGSSGLESTTVSGCDWFTFTLYVVVLGILCVFGLVGNTISFVVLRAERHSHVATFLLQAMAVADNLFLVTTALSQMTTALTLFQESVDRAAAAAAAASASSAVDQAAAAADKNNDDDQLYYSYVVMAYVKVYVWPLVHVCQMWTVWITVLVAFNRYVAICQPFKATRLCTMRHVRIQVICSAVIILLYNVPRFLEHRLHPAGTPLHDVIDSDEYDSVGGGGNATSGDGQLVVPVPYADETKLKRNLVYNIVYENVLYCFFVFLGPLVILVILNACLIRELYLAHLRLRERHLPASLSGPEQGEQNLTLVMIVIVVVFVVCQTPAFINQLVFVIGVEDTCGLPYFYYYHLSNVLITTNSAVNFVVYCVFRRHFRRRLRAYFCRCVGGRDATLRRGSDGSLLPPWPTTDPLPTEHQYVGLRTASMCNSVGRRSMVSVHRASSTVVQTVTTGGGGANSTVVPDIQMSAVSRPDVVQALNSSYKV